MSKASYRQEELLEHELSKQLARNSDKQGSNRYPMANIFDTFQAGDGTLPLHFIERTSQDNKFSARGAGLVAPAGNYSRSEALRMDPDYPANVSVAPHLCLALLLLGLFMLRR